MILKFWHASQFQTYDLWPQVLSSIPKIILEKLPLFNIIRQKSESSEKDSLPLIIRFWICITEKFRAPVQPFSYHFSDWWKSPLINITIHQWQSSTYRNFLDHRLRSYGTLSSMSKLPNLKTNVNIGIITLLT